MEAMDIILRDDRLVVVDKPAAMFVHRTALGRRDETVVLQTLRDQLGHRVYPVHRLDRATSGLLMFALDAEAAEYLSEQFRVGSVRKRYIAIVRGWVGAGGSIVHPLKQPDGREPKAAESHWVRLCKLEVSRAVGRYTTARYSLVALEPRTGRRHQLRRHCAHLTHPIIGDVNYGDRHHNRFFRDELAAGGLMLQAQGLQFLHPDGTRRGCQIPIAERLVRPLVALGCDLDLSSVETFSNALSTVTDKSRNESKTKGDSLSQLS